MNFLSVATTELFDLVMSGAGISQQMRAQEPEFIVMRLVSIRV